ncbi:MULTISPECIES: hypothetical protein [unclassified Caballeronia]|nr:MULTISPECIES: hypothetical protein [unclassified Caballeronia]MDR5739242.1 hypothetical protein [Caballeronia sp. LZ016]MDR5807731.1 hypothetical protein [Caballeronia sp. LZ019]
MSGLNIANAIIKQPHDAQLDGDSTRRRHASRSGCRALPRKTG